MRRNDYCRFVYEFVGGQYNGKRFSYSQLESLNMISGYSENLSEFRERGGCVHREELDDQPLVDGYVGPMYDGMRGDKVACRYETQEVYDLMSD